jgi:hypothetical protein
LQTACNLQNQIHKPLAQESTSYSPKESNDFNIYLR